MRVSRVWRRGAPVRLYRRSAAHAVAESRVRGLGPGAIIGQAGLEQVYNSELMGTDGKRVVIINSRGREIDEDERSGRNQSTASVQLTIDADMQRALEHAFHVDGFNGAAAFIDPRSGEVLAMTSLPAYDPNDFASGISSATWAALNASH